MMDKGNNDSSKNRNALWKIFANLRGAAIIGVLIAHAFTLYSTYATNKAGVTRVAIGSVQLDYHAPIITIGQQFPGYCVPLFLFLAGFSAALSKQTWPAIGQRIKTLLFPFLFWSLFAWLWFAFWAWHGRSPQYSWSVTEFLTRLATGNTMGGYFFFILIFQWYLLFRWLVPFVKRRPGTALLIAISIQFACMIINYSSVIGFPFPLKYAGYKEWYQVMVIQRYIPFQYSAYPVMGIYAGFNDQKLKKVLDGRPFVFVIAIVASALALVLENGFLYHRLADLGYSPVTSAHFSKAEWIASYILWGLVVIFGISAWFRRRIPVSKAYKWINDNAFMLFLLNGPCLLLLDRIFRLFKKVGFVIEFRTYFLILLIFLYELLAPALFKFLVAKFIPKARRVLLG